MVDKMTLNEYQDKSSNTILPLNAAQTNVGAPLYFILGLVGETGEIVEKYKKILRNDNGVLTLDKQRELAKELGDVLWYLAMLAKEFGYTLENIAYMNLDKLADRKLNNKIRGEGDNR